MSSQYDSVSPGLASEAGVEKPKQMSVSSLTSHFERLSHSISGICFTQYISNRPQIKSNYTLKDFTKF